MTPQYAQAAQMQAVNGQATNGQATLGQAVNGQATTVNPNQNLAYIQQYEKLNQQAMQPTFQQQNEALAEQSNARGLSGGAAQYFSNNLAQQQGATMAQMNAPIVQQGYGYGQQDIQSNQAALNTQGLANQGYQNQFGLANMGAQNTQSLANQGYQNQFGLANLGYNNAANQFNAGNQQTTNLANAGYGNAANQYNATNLQNANLANQQAQNQAAEFNANLWQNNNQYNTSAQNAAINTNAQYYDQMLTGNAASYDQWMNQLYNGMQSYLSPEEQAYFNAYTPNNAAQNLITGGLGNAQSAYQDTYSTAAQNGLNNLYNIGQGAANVVNSLPSGGGSGPSFSNAGLSTNGTYDIPGGGGPMGGGNQI
jgi:hypothetical protein